MGAFRFACAIEVLIVPALPFSRSRRPGKASAARRDQTAASAGAMAAVDKPSRSGETYCWR
jgi:hypothetical protein